MQTPAITQTRGLEVSARLFRRIATATVVMLVLIVGTGATVRLTGSGLGCTHWPTCGGIGDPLPKSYHSYVEFGNRVVSGVTVLATLVLAVAAWLTPVLGRGARVLAVGVFVGTLGQAPLGAVTVHYDLHPYLVISHLLLSLVVLALGVLVSLEAARLVRGGGAPLPAPIRWGGLVLVAAASVLVVTGTLSTAAGRFPGSSGSTVVPRLGDFHDAVWLHVRAAAAFGIVFVVLAVWSRLRRAEYPWLARGCAVLLVAVLAQVGIGELQYRTYGTVPWGVVVLHVVVAASVFALTVGLAARLWRPVGID